MVFLRFKYFANDFRCLQNLMSFRFIHKNKLNMSGSKTAYVHLITGSDKFKVSFQYINESVNVNRQFNFERRSEETIQCFLARVTVNLEKIVDIKLKKKRKKEQNDEDKKVANVVVQLFSGEDTVPDSELCKDVFFTNKYPFGSLKLKMMGIDYNVAINSPWIDQMTLPTSIMAGFPVYTNCFETKYIDKSLSSFIWMKSRNKSVDKVSSPSQKSSNKEDLNNWSVVGESFVYIPATADIGHKLRLECTPKNATAIGPPVLCETNTVVEAGPGYCPFENRHAYTRQSSSHQRFRVVSYNILADVYSSTSFAQSELFGYCPTYALNIDYRKQLILKELLGYNADLVCLQEVETKLFESDLVPVLGEQGLVGVHAKKSTIREGVSTFYSPSKFKLLDTQEVILGEELVNKSYCSRILATVEKNTQLKERITGLGTTALALTLENNEKPGEILVVGNTHFYFHPDADHIRLLQGGILIAFLSDIVDSIKAKNPGKNVSLLCCGDFNSVPECGIYKLMTENHVPADFVDWRSKPEEEVKELSLSQPYKMQSACGTPKYTNFTVGFADCLDYIYYQTDRLKVEAVVPLPSEEELRQHTAIPSVVFPSDHVALIADLCWLP
ncbi:2',5'-phosphodiesterase 12-like isoform X2 [Homalodisca vitripennis]|uniref:2',5'-phosphodiesterase 12-like isoform X1 n=2 Tax=Homalodisca vitripennis TaxID=197043 RepID=UPI001EEABA07|nr:2',5'-phosphodiesterase 12-like isoform X1 [Homalodisca vitripennis]XP_046675711.1 2',5'-phosphodiesterase 12-like isoform X2 [Homalodisca vitripennis]